ncbi:MAG TPA: 3-isopropylmalate dehydratase small subunit [Candidatus Dormibacteraeota bacterium]|jgi:3-isopropylmalate dehydratase small subunit|nr:3-isopropylmalate dehydratase small subunit [Candidatus Dormibacteraeota bacterium]
MDPVKVIEGPVSDLPRGDVDTDQIIPKQFLKGIERTGFGRFLFHDWARTPGWNLPANPILVAGRNFGCGSSREHAAWAIQDYGFRAVIAPSFGDIFFSNATKVGLLPIRLPDEQCRAVAGAGEARVDLAAGTVASGGRTFPFEIDPETRRRLLEGLDDIALTLQQTDRIDRFETERETLPWPGPSTIQLVDGGRPRDWEAGTYHRVSLPHAGWGADVISRLSLAGDETVLDAGCGSGKVTAQLLERLPRGRVIGVDAAPSMIEEARRLLPPSVELRVQDLTRLELSGPVDAVVSSAVFHWIADHDRLFARLAAALRSGGRLEAQCGGAGNTALMTAAIGRVSQVSPWREYLGGWPGPWNFAGAEETEERLRNSGFTEVRCWLVPREVRPDDPVAFLRSVVLGSHLQRIPAGDHAAFVDAVHAQMVAGDRERGGQGECVVDYVRLNISAVRE